MLACGSTCDWARQKKTGIPPGNELRQHRLSVIEKSSSARIDPVIDDAESEARLMLEWFGPTWYAIYNDIEAIGVGRNARIRPNNI
jgi:hypothetical protein